MKLQPVLIALTAINLGLLGYQAVHAARAQAAADDIAPVLRGKALQIVDNAGKVRASISLMPAEKLKDGSTYPETVLLRLIDSRGRPNVKISALEDGSAMSLASSGPAYAQVLARSDRPELNLVGRDGEKLKP